LIGDGAARARYADILVLYATRADLAVFENAFRQAGIPYLGDRRGGLLDTLEARDLAALLTVLVTPLDDLALAHCLKSPMFAFTDADLSRLAREGGREGGQDGGPWWRRLEDWARAADAPPRVVRAAALLAGWRDRVGRLPVHDLLDRIFHEADVVERYRAAVPAHLRASVLANLEGFLGLSLALSGGRYPSLPRFLDELRQLRDKAGQDGPDEPPSASGDAVRMLTIHGAKGLEAPVVFLIKADQGGAGDPPFGVALDWPPEDDRPAHFSLYGGAEWRGPGRDGLFERERAQAGRERLNLLYVAMTRARQALFISGSNTAFAHPIAFRRVEDARKANPDMKLVVIDPRRTDTAEAADLHLPLLPGTDIALYNAMLHIMLWEGWVNRDYVDAHTEGFDALKKIVRQYTPAMAATIIVEATVVAPIAS